MEEKMITCNFILSDNRTKTFTNEAVDFCFWDFLEDYSEVLEEVVFVEYTDTEWDVDITTGKPYWSEFHAIQFRKKYKKVEDDFKSGKSWNQCLFVS